MCVCWRGAVYVPLRDCLQPARGGMGRWPGHRHVGAPPPALGAGRSVSLALAGWLSKQHVCVLARRRLCFSTQALSTSPWRHGTLARSPACWCAAALCWGCRGWIVAGGLELVPCWCNTGYVLRDCFQPARRGVER
eukprot:scaffold47727_cov69-Phaeocystis_antarctica.AAC.4